MKSVLLCLVAIGFALPARADSMQPLRDEWDIYRTFLVEPACGLAKNVDACIKVLDLWKRDWMWATDPHWKNQLVGQRNIAFCLASGCEGVKTNRLLGCAWAKLVLRSGDPKLGDEDIAFERDACTALTSAGERDVAEAQAGRLLKMLNAQ